MDLILWRHAEAEEAQDGTNDNDRKLTARGKKQAQQMADWLRTQRLSNLRILSSPAESARQTAYTLGLPFKVKTQLGVDATAGDLLTAVEWPDFAGAAILIGHQPGLGRLASLLLSGQEADWTIKKGGIWWFSNRVRQDESQTVVRAVINPDNVANEIKAASHTRKEDVSPLDAPTPHIMTSESNSNLPACENCRYFFFQEKSIGSCHRHPPLFAGESPKDIHRWRFPVVTLHAWCGEHTLHSSLADAAARPNGHTARNGQ
ncbi:MAG TPA: histidine phosphatase family protein [Rhodocyclaceae bacterium]|nr:histidine phosphatase family protein [Rhodocyclaceae bacterium]